MTARKRLWCTRLTIAGYDTIGLAPVTLHVATIGHTTKPSDTPANTYFAPRLVQPEDSSRDMFNPGGTSGISRPSTGDAIIANGDGKLDAWLDYAFDGWLLIKEEGTVSGGFTETGRGTMLGAEFGSDTITLKLRDRQAEMDTPAQTTLYLGDNSGLEGGPELLGKSKPWCLGRVEGNGGGNVPAVCVNPGKQVYQVADALVHDIPNVYDKGLRLGSGLYIAAGGIGSGNTFSASVDSDNWAVSPGPPGGSAQTCSIIGGNGEIIVGAGPGIWVSLTGSDWTFYTIDAGFQIKDIAYNGTNYCAVGLGGQIWTATVLSGTWASRANSFGGTDIFTISYGAFGYMAAGALGKLEVSNTGAIWAAQTSGTIHDILTSCFDVTTFTYIIAGLNNYVATATVATTWHAQASAATGTPDISSLSVGGGLVIMGTSDGQICTSADSGVTWIKRISPFASSEQIYATLAEPGVFLAAGSNGLVARSDEGIAWPLVNSGYGAGDAQLKTLIHATLLQIGTYANTTDLLDDSKAPAPGTYKICLTAGGSYFRLGSSGETITADVIDGATSADRSTAQLFAKAMVRWGYVSGTDFSATDVTALDVANNAECGRWFGPGDSTTKAGVADLIAGGAGCWWGPDQESVFRIKRLEAPAGSPVLNLVAKDLTTAPVILATNDDTSGIPPYQVIVQYAQNYTVQTTDLAGAVDDARRAVVAQQWRNAQYSVPAVLTAHKLSTPRTVQSLFVNASDALAEATRLQGLQGKRYELVPGLTPATAALDLGNVIKLTHKRYGFSGGRLLTVLGRAPDSKNKKITLTAWAA